VTAGHSDIDVDALVELAETWGLAPLRSQVGGPYAADVKPGDTWTVEDAGVVTSAPQFARLTLSVAADRRATGTGARLVYGRQTSALRPSKRTVRSRRLPWSWVGQLRSHQSRARGRRSRSST
jgi:hypothetical protein